MMVFGFTILLAVVAVILAVVAARRDRRLLAVAAKDTKAQFLHLLPRLLIGILGSGFLARLMPRDLVLTWFGPESGLLGTFLATIAGALTPGGPVVGYAIGASALKAGADVAQVVAYVTAWSLLTFSRIMSWELPIMQARMVALRIVVSLPFPFFAAWVAGATRNML